MEMLRARSSRSLEHVFNLLGLVLPRDPLRVAMRAVHASDISLHAVAVEYLENVLPPMLRKKFIPVLECEPASSDRGNPDEAIEKLMASSASIQINLENLRAKTTPPE